MDREEPGSADEHSGEKAPATVKPVSRFAEDVAALKSLTSGEKPPRVLARPKESAVAAMMFGDASGADFGTSLWIQEAADIHAEHGIWTCTYSKRSSNFCELYNLVARVESMVNEEEIPRGTELFIFTDNSTAESAFYCGTSKSKLLFELVLRLRKMEMHGVLFIHVIWVTGTQMIKQGTDGLSRGDLMNGVLSGQDMLTFVPLNRGVED
ncbi:hypothetical protein ACA910_019224 [Epithemia clementina (nom. ined.)]